MNGPPGTNMWNVAFTAQVCERQFDALFEMVQRGDPAAAGLLYGYFGPGLRTYLRRNSARLDVNDLVFSIFLTVARGIRNGDVTDPDGLLAYVLAVAKARAGQSPHAFDVPSPEAQAEIMNRVLSSMTRRQRDILMRFYHLGQSEETIAREMRGNRDEILSTKSVAFERYRQFALDAVRQIIATSIFF